MSNTGGCEKCPFKDLPKGMDSDALKARLRQNYERNYMGCRQLWPGWKPGLCHKGGIICAGYELLATNPNGPATRLLADGAAEDA